MPRHLAHLASAALALARRDARRPRRYEPVLHSDDGASPAPRRGELGFSERGADEPEDGDVIFEDTPLGGAPAKAHKRAIQRRSAQSPHFPAYMLM
ncbi:hypothetical protein HETIRDRAFT_101566 [Heterobasidion irregulare TC 32-1]|uniref:Uncharacterized protein n=1 Tax=Heterobasidion irregulare (strain TC 32-1) TaxID=747525 RepID=W4K3J8_HETIT|nr:uncharacterized protein HETIRDRAFT_101566 [Heterobasidion irregulare TC 32-1]ETW80408.1 hypothetical protein HETIRDRAFT_101566 [Heterobasidion irregulare TC 32-1]